MDTSLDAVLQDIDRVLHDASTQHPAALTVVPEEISALLRSRAAARSTVSSSSSAPMEARVAEVARVGNNSLGLRGAGATPASEGGTTGPEAGLSEVHSAAGIAATVALPPPLIPPAVAVVRDALAAERHHPVQGARSEADPSDGQVKRSKQRKSAAEELDDGVLPKAGPLMGVLQGAVGFAAAGEAAFNIFMGAHKLLQLPLYMALMAPMLFEALASSFAIQDLQDRRRGAESKMMARAAWTGITVSAVVGGLVGFSLYGPFGVLAAAASIAFGGMLHVHGERAIRAHKSRMKQSGAWKQAQQRIAETHSAREVLELLLPRDADGQATVDLLHKRMDAGTLTPGDALIAAGWHRRTERALSESQMIRLETVAATVWGKEGLPSPPVPPASPGRGASRRSSRHGTATGPTQAGASAASATQAGSTGGASTTAGATQAPQGASETTQRRQMSDAALTEWVRLHLVTHPDDGERPIARALNQAGYSGSAKRIREALKIIKGRQDTPQSSPDVPAIWAPATEGGDGL